MYSCFLLGLICIRRIINKFINIIPDILYFLPIILLSMHIFLPQLSLDMNSLKLSPITSKSTHIAALTFILLSMHSFSFVFLDRIFECRSLIKQFDLDFEWKIELGSKSTKDYILLWINIFGDIIDRVFR